MINPKNFDEIIKSNIYSPNDCNLFGYTVPTNSGTKKVYDCYYSRSAFQSFLSEMQNDYPKIYDEYSKGKGDELSERKTHRGIFPPKMASVASSSRFCYLALRNISEINFEFSCPINGIMRIPPQLDAYIPKNNIFIEVKCHEIFSPHKIIMSNAYRNLVVGAESCFKIETVKSLDDDRFEIPFTEFGFTNEKSSSMFDIKQFICHLLGISSNKASDEHAKLMYLFFKPKTDFAQNIKLIDEAFDILRSEIETIFNSKPIKYFAELNRISLHAVAQYSKTMESISKDNIITLASANTYGLS